MLWFDDQAGSGKFLRLGVQEFEGQADHTLHRRRISRKERPGDDGFVRVDGQEFTALNGGPDFKLTEAVSFVINCDTQEEINYYWEKLTSDGGKEKERGWVADSTASPGR
jgi:predicted 3-demethylubiquinone-9 3-methyltransferase (glyoxalase superfamily)